MLKRFDILQGSFAPAHAYSAPAPVRLGDGPATPLFGLDLVNGSLANAADAIVAMTAGQAPMTIQFINAHCVNTLYHDEDYRAALARADYLLPDGSGMGIAARLAGVAMGENLNGTDLFPELCRRAAQRGQSIYLLGGKPGIAEAAAAKMIAANPGLRFAGTRDGYWSAAEEERVIAEINASGAAIVMVGLGVPLQEKWIARVRHRLTARVVMGVGGLFDYYSGAVQRAPLAVRKLGCEWAWRLLLEPRRLFVRYVLGNPMFLMAAAAHAWQARGHAAALSARIKRSFDLAAVLTALALFLPLFAIIALAIKLEDGGSVFFRQTRIGQRGLPFRMWKFRSMVPDAEARLATLVGRSERDGTCFKMRRDPRVTRVGALLRRLSLDELPQLFNVVTGEMSLVGPRPGLPREVLALKPDQRERLAGQPGLTCTWQVSGRAEIPFEQQVRLDIEYLRTRSLLKDIMLILRTVPAVLSARGAY